MLFLLLCSARSGTHTRSLMGNSLSSLTGAVSLFGLVGLALAATANQPSDWLQIYFQPDGSLSLLPVVATVVAGLIVVYLIKSLRAPKNLAPQVPYKIPFVGSALELAQPVTFLQAAHQKYGEIIRVHMGGADWTFLDSPDGRKAFFEAPEEVLCARKAYGFTIPVFGKGVVYDADASLLMQHRRFAASGLTIKRFQLYAHQMQEESVAWTDEHWGKEGTANLLESLNEITLLTSTRAIQGPEVRNRFTKEFASLYNDLDRALGMISFMFPYLPIPLHRRRDAARETIRKLYMDIIKRRRDNPAEYNDLIETLMEATYPDGSHVTDDEIVGICIALLLAGQHTSNVTSTWTLLYILSHPDIKERVMAELDEIWPADEKDFELTYDHLRRMEFMNNCIKETLRLRPPIVMVFRYTEVDWQFKDFVVPAGNLVSISPAVANRDPNIWTNPDEYDPDRFSKERAEDKKAKYAYLAFSAGRHACIGEQFAYVQVMAIMATLLRKYEFEPIGKASTLEPDYATMIVAPKFSDIKYKLRQ